MITEQEKLIRQERAVAIHKWISPSHFNAKGIAFDGSGGYMSNIDPCEVMAVHGEAAMGYIVEATGGRSSMKDYAVILAESGQHFTWLDICKYYLGEAVFLLAEEIMDDGNCGEGDDQ